MRISPCLLSMLVVVGCSSGSGTGGGGGTGGDPSGSGSGGSGGSSSGSVSGSSSGGTGSGSGSVSGSSSGSSGGSGSSSGGSSGSSSGSGSGSSSGSGGGSGSSSGAMDAGFACASPSDCGGSGQVCCGNIMLTGGSPPSCNSGGVTVMCTAGQSCPTTLGSSCTGTEVIRLCKQNTDCTEGNYGQCCTFPGMNGQSLSFCANSLIASFANATCM